MTLMRAASDASTQLMQLRQSERLRVLDEHHRRVRHVHADFDQRCGEQHIHAILTELRHHRFFLRRLHATVQQPHIERREFVFQRLKLFSHRFQSVRVFFHARINHVSLPTFGESLPDELPHLRQLVARTNKRLHATAPCGHLINRGQIQITVKRETQRARNRRGRQHEQMRIISFTHELFALRDTKLVLLINDHEAELGQSKSTREQRVSADEDSRGSRVEGRARGSALAFDSRLSTLDRLLRPRLHLHVHAERFEPTREVAEVLLRENFRGRHQRHVEPALQRHQRRARRHSRLARADIALQQTPHRMRPAHVRADFSQHPRLRVRELEAKLREKRLDEMIVTGASQSLRAGLKLFPSRLNLQLQRYEFIQRETLPREFHIRQLLREMNHANRVGAGGKLRRIGR